MSIFVNEQMMATLDRLARGEPLEPHQRSEIAELIIDRINTLAAENRRLRAACEGVLWELDYPERRMGLAWCARTLAAALAPAAAGGEGGERNG